MKFSKIAFALLTAAACGAASASVVVTTPSTGTTVLSENFNSSSSFSAGWYNTLASSDDYLWLSGIGVSSSSYQFSVSALDSLALSFNYTAFGNTSTVTLSGPTGETWNLSSTGLGFLLSNPGASNSYTASTLSDLAAGTYTLTFSTSGLLGGLKVDDVKITTIAAVSQPVPEPETYALMLSGLAAIGFIAGRRRKQA
jgi:hypothetical protein